MLFEPIPKHVLIHEVVYQAPTEEDDGGMGGGVAPDPIDLKGVRFAPTRKRITTSDNREILTNGILYIDSVNSETFLIPDVDGEITFRNKRLSIVEVKELYTDEPTPHHVAVMLQ